MTADPFEPTRQRARQSNILTVRLKPSGFAWLNEQVAKHGVAQTEVVKAALAFAATQPDFKTFINDRKAEQ